MDLEPNIVKAQFIVTNSRIYTLEFDQNIEFRELKEMIRVAAHLKKNNFRLFCEGEECTQYNEETYETIFPDQKLVVFTLQKGEGEVFDETELLIPIVELLFAVSALLMVFIKAIIFRISAIIYCLLNFWCKKCLNLGAQTHMKTIKFPLI